MSRHGLCLYDDATGRHGRTLCGLSIHERRDEAGVVVEDGRAPMTAHVDGWEGRDAEGTSRDEARSRVCAICLRVLDEGIA